MITATRTEIADLLDKAAKLVTANGHHKRFLYDTRQADGGTPLNECRVDIIGALNIAAHGTPRYAGSLIVHAAEQALLTHVQRPSLVVWNDDKVTTKDIVIAVLADVASELRDAS